MFKCQSINQQAMLESIERVCNQSRLVVAQFLLDSVEIRDNFRHSISLLSFNKVCEIIVHLATQ